MSLDENPGVFAGEGPGIAIAISQAKHGRFGVSLQDGAPVGNTVSFWELVHEGDAGFEGHHRNQEVLVVGEW